MKPNPNRVVKCVARNCHTMARETEMVHVSKVRMIFRSTGYVCQGCAEQRKKMLP